MHSPRYVRADPPNDLVLVTTIVLALAICAAIAGMVVAGADDVAVLLLAALPLLPIVMFSMLKALGGDRAHGAVLSVVIVFLLAAYFRTRGYEEKGIDYQIALRLGALACMAVMTVPFVPQILRRLNPTGAACWIGFLFFSILTALYSVEPSTALVSTGSLLVGFGFVCFLLLHHGPERAASIIGIACSLLAMSSLVLYVVHPEFGRVREWVGNDFVLTFRLKGLLGSSNGAGASTAAGLFVIIAFQQTNSRAARLFRICGAAAAFACLILSNNRMALLALGVAGTVSYVLSGGTARKAVAAVAVATILVSLAALFHEDISVAAARSGDASEVATLTGRTEIWAVVLAMAVEAPVLGYGFGSSLFILSKHPDLFLAAAHAHNVYLEQLFTGGMIGLGLFVASIAVTIALGVKSGAAKETALMSFFVVYGFTEPIINGPINLGVIVMFLATGMILVRTAPASQGRLATPRQVAHRGEVDDRQLARDTDP